VAEVAEVKGKRRVGFKRWLILGFIILEIILAGLYPPIPPAVELAAEPLTDTVSIPILGDVALTNTILTVFIADILLILAAIAVYRAYQGGGLQAPRGIAGVFEMIVEAMYNLVQSVAGSKWARTFFPLVGTILILVLTVNFMKLLPGMESIGFVHEIHEGEGYDLQAFGPVSILAEPAEGETGHYNIIPWFRPASTDLNFTLSIALVAMISVQIIGLRAGGIGYFEKFANFRNFIKMWAREKLGAFDILMPFIDIFIGILELIAEFARIISFTFRLFGSMFAGAVLLGVVGSLFLFVQTGFLFLEIFFGGVQAFVFAMLTLVFLTMATQTHGGGGHEEPHEAH